MRYNSQIVDGKEAFYSSDWINQLESEQHFSWYHKQLELVYKYCGRNQRLLEIGIGNSCLSDILKRRGWGIKTLDIDEEKAPDFVLPVSDFKFNDHDFNTILAFEIFEHIPFDTFEKTIRNISESSAIQILFSVPRCEKLLFKMSLKLPKLSKFTYSISVPSSRIIEKNHHWELGKVIKLIEMENIWFLWIDWFQSSVNWNSL